MTLPDLFPLDDFINDQRACVRRLYMFFEENIVNADLQFLDCPLRFQRRPEINGVHHNFYHLISKESALSIREINFNRCQRIPWIPYVIKNHNNCSMIKCWENIRYSKQHIVLWLHEYNYLVILAKRPGYFLLKTAYPIEEDHMINKLVKESKRSTDPRKS
jgi:hypothetical protein